MIQKSSLAAKIVGAVVLAFLGAMAVNLWVTARRVNSQEEEAFRDKVRQIAGMAAATRAWYSKNINLFVPDRNFKKVEQVPVVVAWKVAQEYASAEGMQFSTPSLHPRDPHHAPDDFERRALQAFDRDSSLTEYSEIVEEGGKQWMRYAQPVRLTSDCLTCHGDPAGEKDPFGYTKEGMKAGDLRGAFSVKAPADELVENARSNSVALLLASIITLIGSGLAVAWLIRKIVTQPLSHVRDTLVALAHGDLTGQVEVRSEDDMGKMGHALNDSIHRLREMIGSMS